MITNLIPWAIRENLWSPSISVPAISAALSHLDSVLAPQHRILDVGTGLGQIPALMTERQAATVGVDMNPDFLQYARTHYPNVHFVRADAESLPFGDGSFDGVFSYSTMQYPRREIALAECARVLKPGGKFAIIENLSGNPVAKTFRLWAHFSNHEFGQYLQPTKHLAWSDRGLYERFFSEVEYKAFHLATPCLLALRSVRYDTNAMTNWQKKLFSLTSGFDGSIMRISPLLKHFAWIAVIYGEK